MDNTICKLNATPKLAESDEWKQIDISQFCVIISRIGIYSEELILPFPIKRCLSSLAKGEVMELAQSDTFIASVSKDSQGQGKVSVFVRSGSIQNFKFYFPEEWHATRRKSMSKNAIIVVVNGVQRRFDAVAGWIKHHSFLKDSMAISKYNQQSGRKFLQCPFQVFSIAKDLFNTADPFLSYMNKPQWIVSIIRDTLINSMCIAIVYTRSQKEMWHSKINSIGSLEKDDIHGIMLCPYSPFSPSPTREVLPPVEAVQSLLNILTLIVRWVSHERRQNISISTTDAISPPIQSSEDSVKVSSNIDYKLRDAEFLLGTALNTISQDSRVNSFSHSEKDIPFFQNELRIHLSRRARKVLQPIVRSILERLDLSSANAAVESPLEVASTTLL